jgi:hypothetical protein
MLDCLPYPILSLSLSVMRTEVYSLEEELVLSEHGEGADVLARGPV